MSRILGLLLLIIPSLALAGESIEERWERAKQLTTHDLTQISVCITSPEPCAPVVRKYIWLVSEVNRRINAGENVLTAVNVVVNAVIEPRADPAGRDIWSPALETLSRGFGDREDYAALKYALLQSVGIPSANLVLLIGKQDYRQSEQELHAALAYAASDGRSPVLDNLQMEVVEERDRKDFKIQLALE